MKIIPFTYLLINLTEYFRIVKNDAILDSTLCQYTDHAMKERSAKIWQRKENKKMSNHDITVHQLRSLYPGQVWLNVDEAEGHIGVQGCCYLQPMYLIRDGIFVKLITFDSQAFADEWFEEQNKEWTEHPERYRIEINKLEPIEKESKNV